MQTVSLNKTVEKRKKQKDKDEPATNVYFS